jgi:CheY-like chemotaxis protein
MKIMSESDRCMDFELARVLLVDDDPTSRLTLQTVLEASGYHVDSAASAAEAVGKLDEQEYQLVLSDLQLESPEAGLKVLAHARMMDYKPATALVTTYQNAKPQAKTGHGHGKPQKKPMAQSRMLITPEDVPGLLAKVANLISERAARKVQRELRHAVS